jgi:hypothetical protein
VLEAFDVSDEQLTPLPGTGFSASTWMNSRHVIQSRPMDRYELTYAALKLLDEAPPGSLLARVKHHPKLVSDKGKQIQPGRNYQRFWVMCDRVQGTAWNPITDDLPASITLALVGETLPAVVRQLKELAAMRPTQLITEAAPNELLRWQIADSAWVAERYRQCMTPHLTEREIDTILSLEEPASGPLVVAHGDPLLKNTIVGRRTSVLIDWESVFMLPRWRDPAHIASYLIGLMGEEHYDKIIRSVFKLTRVLHDLSYDEWVSAVVWHVIRDTACYGNTSFFKPGLAVRWSRGLLNTVPSLRPDA